MRQIKFRAYTIDEGMIYNKDVDCFMSIDSDGSLNNSGHPTHHVMQFTGIKDKKGVEIFEGDYLVDKFPIDEEDLSKGYNESLLPVVWCDKQLCWSVDASFAKDGSYLTSLVEYFGEFLEVKGNIHERS